MEVTVIETGDLPASTIISFHTGNIRRHAQIEKNKAISLSYVSASEPVRVDLMSQIGTHTFDMVPGQEVYDVPIGSGTGNEVKLKFQIREASSKPEVTEADRTVAKPADNSDFENQSAVSPSRKLQTALMMRSYLDNHDVLRQMQGLLQEMVTHRPEDPIDYMIGRLEVICRNNDALDSDVAGTIVKDEPSFPSAEPTKKHTEAKADKGDSESEEDDDVTEDLPAPVPPPKRERKCSVSEEAYGQFNKRKDYQKKVVPKDGKQKRRLRDVLKHCWIFQSLDAENIETVVDAMSEKIVPPKVKLITQGDAGDVMWVIEEGVLECSKLIGGENKVVKTCKRGDVFGELALLYSQPRAATVISTERCILWELDRETFKAICYEAAHKTDPGYEGFVAPGTSASSSAQVQKADDEDDADDDEETEETRKPMDNPKARRREGVSAEAMRSGGDEEWTPPFFEKSAEERQQLSNIIRTSPDSKLHMLFGTVSKETFEKIVDAMSLKKIAKGEDVIAQGGVGDYFYIVKTGDFDIYVKKGEEPPKKVFQAGVGFAFGELALLYNAPRSATITASCEAEVWALDRSAFRNLVVRSSEAQFKQRTEFLDGVDIFQVLNENERASLAEVLEEEEFDDDEAIVEQGEKDDKMFILRSGKAVACIKGAEGEVEVKHYNFRDYFGEIALLTGEARKASVYAVGSCSCLYITRQTFLRVLGPLQNLLERNISKYAKYQDAILEAKQTEEQDKKHADAHKDDDHKNEEEFHEQDQSDKKKVHNRKRDRATEVLDKLSAKKVEKELSPEGEPETLADKVAQDFKNPALVTPTDGFSVTGCQMMMFGGIIPGQKFTNDKVIHVRASIKPSRSGEDEVYSWQGSTKLKLGTEIGACCQKGQKSSSDPTPNQDNFFIHHAGAISMYGVCDGHGPFGHLVSFRLVQTLPFFIMRNRQSGKDWDIVLKEAFLESEKDLEDFCSEQNVNIDASGAAGTVLILEEQTLHVAYIGDARIMLGSWNRHDSRMILATQDHKPDLPEEKARLEAAGSEVREIDPGNHRIYLKGSNFPGLTMSRAFGDTVCAGVSREPEYHKVLMQPTDQWYAVVASDGIWEFMTGEEVCNLTAKKLRLKGPTETVNFLVNASRKRWTHVCGDYCDDITAILVQWNAPLKDNNHALTVKRPE